MSHGGTFAMARNAIQHVEKLSALPICPYLARHMRAKGPIETLRQFVKEVFRIFPIQDSHAYGKRRTLVCDGIRIPLATALVAFDGVVKNEIPAERTYENRRRDRVPVFGKHVENVERRFHAPKYISFVSSCQAKALYSHLILRH